MDCGVNRNRASEAPRVSKVFPRTRRFRGEPAIHPAGVCSVLLLMVVVIACGTVKPSAPPVTPEAPAIALPSPYVLVPGDLIDVKLYYNADLNETLRVRPDGKISMQLIGEVEASGVSPAELADQMKTRFAAFVPHPSVAVIVREFAPPKVYVGGEVNIPSALALHGGLTSVQAILSSGGAKRSANLRQVLVIHHDGNDAVSVTQLDVKRVQRGEVVDVALQPYDIVYVPMSPIAEVGNFVQQYINDIIPRNVSFPFVYSLNPSVSVQ